MASRGQPSLPSTSQYSTSPQTWSQDEPNNPMQTQMNSDDTDGFPTNIDINQDVDRDTSDNAISSYVGANGDFHPGALQVQQQPLLSGFAAQFEADRFAGLDGHEKNSGPNEYIDGNDYPNDGTIPEQEQHLGLDHTFRLEDDNLASLDQYDSNLGLDEFVDAYNNSYLDHVSSEQQPSISGSEFVDPSEAYGLGPNPFNGIYPGSDPSFDHPEDISDDTHEPGSGIAPPQPLRNFTSNALSGLQPQRPTSGVYGQSFAAQSNTQHSTPPTGSRKLPSGEADKKEADKKKNKSREKSFRDKHGEWWHQLHESDKLAPAVRHCDIWEQLRATADSQGSYIHPPEQGNSDYDRTSFVRAHQPWGSDRAHRPDVLFQFYKDDSRLAACQPQRWLYQGRRVLDHWGKWMWDYPDVPPTISSVAAGWRLEAYMRRNPSLTLDDILGRTPRRFLAMIKGKLIWHDVYGETTFRNRMMRFRWEACLISWINRDEHGITQKYFEELLDKADRDTSAPQSFRELNSTRTFGRDLSAGELKELKRRRGAATTARENTKAEMQKGTSRATKLVAKNTNQTGIFPMDRLHSAMPNPPKASDTISQLEDYGDLEVGNHDSDVDSEDSSASSVPPQEQHYRTIRVPSKHRRPLGELQVVDLNEDATILGSDATRPNLSTTYQIQSMGHQPGRHEAPEQSATQSDTQARYSSQARKRRREPMDNIYDIQDGTHVAKKHRVSEESQSPRLVSNSEGPQAERPLSGLERALLQPTTPHMSVRDRLRRRNLGPNHLTQASPPSQGARQYQTAPIHGQKRGHDPTEGPDDGEFRVPSPKRHRTEQMPPPLITASGKIVGSSRKREAARRSGVVHDTPTLRANSLRQGALAHDNVSHSPRPIDPVGSDSDRTEEQRASPPPEHSNQEAAPAQKRVRMSFPAGARICLLPPDSECAFITTLAEHGSDWYQIDRRTLEAGIQQCRAEQAVDRDSGDTDRQPNTLTVRSPKPRDEPEIDYKDTHLSEDDAPQGASIHNMGDRGSAANNATTDIVPAVDRSNPDLDRAMLDKPTTSTSDGYRNIGEHSPQDSPTLISPNNQTNSYAPHDRQDLPSDKPIDSVSNVVNTEAHDRPTASTIDSPSPATHRDASESLSTSENPTSSHPQPENQPHISNTSQTLQSESKESDSESGDEYEFFPPGHWMVEMRRKYRAMPRLW